MTTPPPGADPAAEEPRYTLAQLGLAPSLDPDVVERARALLDAPVDELAYARGRRQFGLPARPGDAELLRAAGE